MEKKIRKIKVNLLRMEEKDLPIQTPFIKLDAALKYSDVAATGGHAKLLIEKGSIRVNGEVCTLRGKKLYNGDAFEYKNLRYTVRTADEN